MMKGLGALSLPKGENRKSMSRTMKYFCEIKKLSASNPKSGSMLIKGSRTPVFLFVIRLFCRISCPSFSKKGLKFNRTSSLAISKELFWVTPASAII
jgi:hypothetical protein